MKIRSNVSYLKMQHAIILVNLLSLEVYEHFGIYIMLLNTYIHID